jgi:hypothetical protein
MDLLRSIATDFAFFRKCCDAVRTWRFSYSLPLTSTLQPRSAAFGSCAQMPCSSSPHRCIAANCSSDLAGATAEISLTDPPSGNLRRIGCVRVHCRSTRAAVGKRRARADRPAIGDDVILGAGAKVSNRERQAGVSDALSCWTAPAGLRRSTFQLGDRNRSERLRSSSAHSGQRFHRLRGLRRLGRSPSTSTQIVPTSGGPWQLEPYVVTFFDRLWDRMNRSLFRSSGT